jgi:hypothetical protein
VAVTYKQLYQKVMLRLKTLDGRALLASKEAVNSAQKAIARIADFDELKTWDITHAVTVAHQKNYLIGATGWALVRCKDILSIKLMDTSNSRKLEYKSPTEMDALIPYPEDLGEQRCRWYTQRGLTIELFPIPDAVYTLYIYHTQWPLELSADTDAMTYPDDMDDVIVAIAADMANAILDGVSGIDWAGRAKSLLGSSVQEELNRPDRVFQAKPFDAGTVTYTGEYWKQPFVKEVR